MFYEIIHKNLNFHEQALFITLMNDDVFFVLNFEFFFASIIREQDVLWNPTDASCAHKWPGRHHHADLVKQHAVKVEHIT
jgi:hypothetical protein